MAWKRSASVVIALSLAFSAAGCSEGSGASSEEQQSSSPSPSPTSSPSELVTKAATPEPPKAPKTPNTTKGKKAFARHVADLWGYALRTNDAEPLTRLSPKKKPCTGCKQFSSALRKREKQGWYVDFPGVEIKKAEVKKDGRESAVTMQVTIPQSDSYNEDGSYRATNPEHEKGGFEVQMRRTKNGFQLLGFRVS